MRAGQRRDAQLLRLPPCRHDPGRLWASQYYSRLLPQLPELQPSALANTARSLMLWGFLPSERWQQAYWQAVGAAAGAMFPESLTLVRGTYARGSRACQGLAAQACPCGT